MNIYRKNYRLDLFSPANEYLGEIEVNNLDIELSYDDYSSISFTMPEKIGLNNEWNEKVDITKEIFELELSLGDLVNSSPNAQKIRFIITETDTSFADDMPTYRYSGLSKEFKLSMFQINNWQGLERFEYEFEVAQDIAPYDNTDPNDTKYITISDTDLGNIQDNEYIRVQQEYYYDQELRYTTELIEIEETAFDADTNPILDSEYMTEGYFFFDANDGSIQIKKPDIISETADVHYRYKVYYMPKDYQDQGIGASKHYFFSKDGLYPKELIENLLSFSNIEFTVDTIDSNINETRSDFDFNEINVYEALQKVAEAFHATLIFDTVQKTVSMWKQENIGENKGLFLEYGKYLKDFSYSRSLEDFTTNLIPIGQDGLTILDYNPSGKTYIEKYSFFQNSKWMSDELLNVVNKWQENYDTYLDLMLINTDNLFLIDETNTISWYNHSDKFSSTVLDSIDLSDYNLEVNDLQGGYLFKAPISLNHEAILEKVTKLETRVVSSEAKYNTYVKLQDTFEKRSDSDKEAFNENFYRKFTYPANTHPDLSAKADTTVEYQNIEAFYDDIVKHYQFIYEQSEMRLNRLKYILAIYSALIEDIHQKMDKKEYMVSNLGLTELEADELLLEWYQFQKQKTVHEDTITTGHDLLSFAHEEILDYHKPEFTFDVSLIDILNSKESEQDWNNLIVGDRINFKFDKFNINEEFQIKTINYSPDGQDLRFTLSNAYRYNKSFNRKILNRIKDLSIDNRNLTEYLTETYKQLDNNIEEVKQQVEDIASGRTDIEEEENGTVSIVDTGIDVSYRESDESGNFLKVETGKLSISSGGIHIYEPGANVASTAINVHGIAAQELTTFNTDSQGNYEKVFNVDNEGNILFNGNIRQGTLVEDENGNTVSLMDTIEENSLSAVYYGRWDSNVNYVRDTNIKHIVEHEGQYYEATQNSLGQIPSDTSDYWKSFSANFTSLASELAITNQSIVKDSVKVGQNSSIEINGSDSVTPYISFGQNKEIDIVGNTSNPYLAIGQNSSPGFSEDGVFLGLEDSTAKFSVSSTSSTDSLTWNGSALGIRGDLNLQTEMTVTNITQKGSLAKISLIDYPSIPERDTDYSLKISYIFNDTTTTGWDKTVRFKFYYITPSNSSLVYTSGLYGLVQDGESGPYKLYSMEDSQEVTIDDSTNSGFVVKIKMPNSFNQLDMNDDVITYRRTYELNTILSKLIDGNDGLSVGSSSNSYTEAASFDNSEYVANLTGPGVDVNLDLSQIESDINTATANSDNWDTAYGWGDHSLAGYLTEEIDTLDDVVGRDNITSKKLNIGEMLITKDGTNSTGDLVVQGDLTVLGEATEIKTTELKIEDNIMTLNYNATSAAANAGIEINRGSDPNYEITYTEATQDFRIGQTGELQPVLTRSESTNISDGALFKWDPVNFKGVESSIIEKEQDIDVSKDIDMGTKAQVFNNHRIFSSDVTDDVLTLRRYGANHSLLNIMAPPQASWGGARESTLALVRGDGNEYFLDMYNMDYGDTDAGNNMDYGDPKMGIRIQKRGTGTYSPFNIEYHEGTHTLDPMKAIEITPRNTSVENQINDTLVKIVNDLSVEGFAAFEDKIEVGNLTIVDTNPSNADSGYIDIF